MIARRDVLGLGLACLGGPIGLRRATAQGGYPDRPIKLVIPFPPGGIGDAVGRPWADKMKSLLGQVVVENQGGAGGVLGGAAVVHASPDGYTLLLGNLGTHVLLPAAGGSAPYDPAKDLDAISIVVIAALAIVVHPSLSVPTLKDLGAYAEANPGGLSYGSSGAGSASHLTGELFKSLTHARGIISVPYKGGGQMINDVISGHIQMGVVNVTGQILELHRAGKVRMLAVTTPARIIAAPDIPTAVEAGIPGMVAQNFIGLFAPATTPEEIIAQVSRATHDAMADEAFRQRLVASGFEPYPDSSPQAARQFVGGEIARWARLINAIGLKLE